MLTNFLDRRRWLTALCCAALFLLCPPYPARSDTKTEDTLPGEHELSGWQMQGAPYTYQSDTLYQYIDGAADQFIAYGFKKLCGAEYISTADKQESLVIDVYDMGSNLSAFGMFTSKKDPASPSLSIGAESFGNDQYVAFYKDRFYVEIQPRISAEKNRLIPQQAARLVARKIAGVSMRPAQLKIFPKAGKIAGSENYIVGGILGHAFLPQGVVCEYHSDGTVIKAFVAPFSSSRNAQDAFDQYKQFLSALGKQVAQNNTVGERSFSAQEPYHSNIIVAQQGAFVAGITELSSPQQGAPLLKKIIKNLQKPLQLQ
jgi:hypothetical protein